jgi:hypothetical protein
MKVLRRCYEEVFAQSFVWSSLNNSKDDSNQMVIHTKFQLESSNRSGSNNFNYGGDENE